MGSLSQPLRHISILDEATIYVSRSKLELFVEGELDVLGSIVSNDGIKPGPALVNKIINYPIP